MIFLFVFCFDRERSLLSHRAWPERKLGAEVRTSGGIGAEHLSLDHASGAG
jgi:hypothetical protein